MDLQNRLIPTTQRSDGPKIVASISRSSIKGPRNPQDLSRPHEAGDFPVRFIPGVGPRIAELLKAKGIETAADLLTFFPYKYLDRRVIVPIRQLATGQQTVVGKVLSSGVTYFRNRRRIFEILLGDESGAVQLKWFYFYPQMASRFSKGVCLIVSGEAKRFRGEMQFVHPEVEVIDPEILEEGFAPGIVPVYSQIAGVGQKTLRKIVRGTLDHFLLPEILPPEIAARFPDKGSALRQIHFPPTGQAPTGQAPDEISLEELNEGRSPGHRREIFEEFFLMELGLALKRKGIKREEGIPFKWEPAWIKQWSALFPFSLTGAQKRTLLEILKEMEAATPMNRLVQGDVGSGKTVVALLAALVAIKNGYQVALMAPTEILSEQHYRTFQKFLGSLKIPTCLLIGSLTSTIKERFRSRIARGVYSLIIGTHALISDGVEFKKLGLAIIDEQHRFGVLQRAKLKSNGRPDTLVMTATPIPRTMAMTIYGDLDLSVIDEMPPGRRAIRTEVIESRERRRLYSQITETTARGEQGFIIYPLVEESDKLVLKDATRMFEELKKIFPQRRLALLHGRIPPEEKERVFTAFQSGEVDLLVSTTVVEVGIDVPNATLMVVEHADRFGLSQLHQLRGRVGRGDKPSTCLLVSDSRKSEAAFRRLAIMCETQDGFRIAEEDLKIRGPGDFLGTRQAGLPELRIADLLRDQKILLEARKEAFRLVESDPVLQAFPLLKDHLRRRWEGRLKLAEVA